MLKNLGKAPLLVRFGRRVFVCLLNKRLEGRMRDRIRPVVLGPLACWSDKQPAD